MRPPCCQSDERCHVVVAVGVPPILLAAAVLFGAAKLILGLPRAGVPPATVWVPLFLLAAVLTVWGLWLGFTVHRRDGPLLLGVFGLAVTVLGFVVLAPLTVAGVLLVFAASAWSALSYASARTRA